ncbi:histidine--tRNA ligase [Streptomyces violaceorubidus]
MLRHAKIGPLRVLDDRRPTACVAEARRPDAPLLRDYLCDACKAYHEEVRELIAAAGVVFEDDPKLVRGLDYYTRTTFEFVPTASAPSPRWAAGAATTACPR